MGTTVPPFTCKFFAVLPEDEGATMVAEAQERFLSMAKKQVHVYSQTDRDTVKILINRAK